MKKRKSIEREIELKELGKITGGARAYTRCKICGRPHSIIRKYGICRICLRELHNKGIRPQDIKD